MIILGIHIGHDASASLIVDGKLCASAAEERFVRVKHFGGMPINAVRFCLNYADISFEDVDHVAYSGHVGDIKIAQLLGVPQQKILSSVDANQLGLVKRAKALVKEAIVKPAAMPEYFYSAPVLGKTEVHHVSHHRGHASCAYYTSGNSERTLVITADAAGEDGYSLSVSVGEAGELRTLQSYTTNCSYGLFYGLVTEALGWWVGDGEGTTMGLAPYGDPCAVPDDALLPYMPLFRDGQFKQTVDFGQIDGFVYMDTYYWHFHILDDMKQIIEKYGRENVAAKAQELLEKEVITFIDYWRTETKCEYLAAAGGVFLNVKMNQALLKKRIFRDVYVYPDAGDSGLSAGAALEVSNKVGEAAYTDRIKDIRLGTEYTNEEIKHILDERGLGYRETDDVCGEVAKELNNGKIVGWFQGRAECGPRALGGRSILFDPTRAENKDIINKHVKFRQPFRPFCPSMLIESAKEYLAGSDRTERFMVTAYDVHPDKQDAIPAVTHKDGTCRPQMIEKDVNPRFWELLDKYGQLSGVPVLMNTSFNIKGEPIVDNPRDAIKGFYDTGIQVLAIGNYILSKDG